MLNFKISSDNYNCRTSPFRMSYSKDKTTILSDLLLALINVIGHIVHQPYFIVFLPLKYTFC